MKKRTIIFLSIFLSILTFTTYISYEQNNNYRESVNLLTKEMQYLETKESMIKQSYVESILHNGLKINPLNCSYYNEFIELIQKHKRILIFKFSETSCSPCLIRELRTSLIWKSLGWII